MEARKTEIGTGIALKVTQKEWENVTNYRQKNWRLLTENVVEKNDRKKTDNGKMKSWSTHT